MRTNSREKNLTVFWDRGTPQTRNSTCAQKSSEVTYKCMPLEATADKVGPRTSRQLFLPLLTYFRLPLPAPVLEIESRKHVIRARSTVKRRYVADKEQYWSLARYAHK